VSTAVQMTLDGGEVPVSHTRVRLGPNQRQVLRKLALVSHMTSTDAGVIVHEQRGWHGFGAKDTGRPYVGAGCCRYASTDGSALMRSLRERGFVEKQGGLWWLPRREWG